VCINLDKRDRIYSTHRPHGHCIARGLDIKAMMLELYARQGGTCNGKGGSMHLADPDLGIMGANGIVGGGMPLVGGAALAALRLRTGGVAVGFVGDGGSNQGQFLEALNFSSVFKLPAIFVIEDNGYAETIASTWSCAGDHCKRAEGFGMPNYRICGADFFAVNEAASEAIARARAGQGPSLLHLTDFERFYPHEQGISDAMRPTERLEWILENRDPLKIFISRVTESGQLKRAQLSAIDEQIEREVEEAVSEAKAAPHVTAEHLLTDVYVSY